MRTISTTSLKTSFTHDITPIALLFLNDNFILFPDGDKIPVDGLAYYEFLNYVHHDFILFHYNEIKDRVDYIDIRLDHIKNQLLITVYTFDYPTIQINDLLFDVISNVNNYQALAFRYITDGYLEIRANFGADNTYFKFKIDNIEYYNNYEQCIILSGYSLHEDLVHYIDLQHNDIFNSVSVHIWTIRE